MLLSLSHRDIERYEYVSFEPIQTEEMTEQEKIRFIVDNSNEVTSFDWYNTYFSVTMKFRKFDKGTISPNKEIYLAGSGYSII